MATVNRVHMSKSVSKSVYHKYSELALKIYNSRKVNKFFAGPLCKYDKWLN